MALSRWASGRVRITRRGAWQVVKIEVGELFSSFHLRGEWRYSASVVGSGRRRWIRLRQIV